MIKSQLEGKLTRCYGRLCLEKYHCARFLGYFDTRDIFAEYDKKYYDLKLQVPKIQCPHYVKDLI